MICGYVKDPETGERVLIPACWGAVAHWHLEDKDCLEYCSCDRRPRYKRGDRKKLQRLEWRAKKIMQQIEAIHEAARSEA